MIVLVVSQSDVLLGERLEHTFLEDAAPANSQQAAAVSHFGDDSSIDPVIRGRVAGAYHQPEMPSLFVETETQGESDDGHDATSTTERTYYLRNHDEHDRTTSATPPGEHQHLPQPHHHESNWLQGEGSGTASATAAKATLEIENSFNETFAALDWRSPDSSSKLNRETSLGASSKSSGVGEEESPLMVGSNKTGTVTGSSTFSSNSTGPVANDKNKIDEYMPANNNTSSALLVGGALRGVQSTTHHPQHTSLDESTILTSEEEEEAKTQLQEDETDANGTVPRPEGEAGPWHTTGPQLRDDDNTEEEIEQTEAPEETTGPQQQQQLDEREEDEEESVG